jgi:hypothetical protein
MVELIRELKTAEGLPESSKQEGKSAGIASPEHWMTFAYLAGFCFLIYFFGFLAAVAVFVALWIKLHGKGWPAALSFSLGTTLFIYVVFIRALHVPFHEGLVFRWAGI